MSRVTLTGKFTRIDGTPASGTVRITPSRSPILDSAGQVVISGPQTFPLEPDGTLSTPIPASNDPDLGPPFTYTVEALLSHNPWKISKVWIPHGPTTIDISTIADYTPLPGEPTRTVIVPADGEDGQALVWDGAGFVWEFPQGGQGPQGEQGPQGPPGETGPQGVPGEVTTAALTAALAGKQPVGDYATKAELPDVSGLATKSELASGLAGKQDAGDYVTTSDLPDLGAYATTAYVDQIVGDIDTALAGILGGN